MEVKCSCESPVVLLETLRQTRDRGNIYLLDVELKHPEYDGFLLGKEIRNTDPQGIIIYITSFRNLAFKTFQYHIEAFDYIVKDADKRKMLLSVCARRAATIQLVTHSGAAMSYIISLLMTFCILKHPADLILLSCGERSSGSSLWEIYQTLRMNWENDSLRSIAPMWSR